MSESKCRRDGILESTTPAKCTQLAAYYDALLDLFAVGDYGLAARAGRDAASGFLKAE